METTNETKTKEKNMDEIRKTAEDMIFRGGKDFSLTFEDNGEEKTVTVKEGEIVNE